MQMCPNTMLDPPPLVPLRKQHESMVNLQYNHVMESSFGSFMNRLKEKLRNAALKLHIDFLFVKVKEPNALHESLPFLKETNQRNWVLILKALHFSKLILLHEVLKTCSLHELTDLVHYFCLLILWGVLICDTLLFQVEQVFKTSSFVVQDFAKTGYSCTPQIIYPTESTPPLPQGFEYSS